MHGAQSPYLAVSRLFVSCELVSWGAETPARAASGRILQLTGHYHIRVDLRAAQETWRRV